MNTSVSEIQIAICHKWEISLLHLTHKVEVHLQPITNRRLRTFQYSVKDLVNEGLFIGKKVEECKLVLWFLDCLCL